MENPHGGIVHLRAGGTSLVLETTGSLPRVLHWGTDLGEVDAEGLAGLRLACIPQVASSSLDDVVPVSVLPEPARGWHGTPGLAGHRGGVDFSALFSVTELSQAQGSDGDPHRLAVRALDDQARLALDLELEVTSAGLVRMRAAVTNTDSATDYTLDSLILALPLPPNATEILDFTGRHLRERAPQRHAFTLGSHSQENRRGRTGFGAGPTVVGTPGFGFGSGEVYGLHVAWSGNHRTFAERLPSSHAILAGGELLLPGEGTLAPGETYLGPWIYASHGAGLDELSTRFHDELRARPHHPRSQRPVVLNTWEAVYFAHDLGVLTRLADLAAEVGVERFVLDDGWFRGRRDDTAGLGDWFVDREVWPDGLHPLVEHVRSRGMQFGLWVEPEMVNPDSDLARAHPEWILAAGTRMPPQARHQQVLDVAHPQCRAYLLERLDALVSEYQIDFLKWDHNRDLVDPGRSTHGRAGVHEQTAGVYALLDELRARHPHLEIESCSSGGARVDLGILERTDRVWASDCIDALERQQIERWTSILVPPELIGSHVGSGTCHSTGRRHDLSFRAGTALFGHFGIEWDLREATPDELAELAGWVAAYKDHRDLLHTGRVVRGDVADPALQVHGVVARDGSRALYAIVAVAAPACSPPGPIRLPGLAPDASYRVRPLAVGADASGYGSQDHTLPWWRDGVTTSGSVLGSAGVQAPIQFPEHLVLLEVERL